jgi:hypothetical protein
MPLLLLLLLLLLLFTTNLGLMSIYVCYRTSNFQFPAQISCRDAVIFRNMNANNSV